MKNEREVKFMDWNDPGWSNGIQVGVGLAGLGLFFFLMAAALWLLTHL